MTIKTLYLLFAINLLFSITINANENTFITKNKGQVIDKEVFFIYNGNDYRVFFQKNKISYVFTKTTQSKNSDLSFENNYLNETYRIDMEVLNTNPYSDIKSEKSILINYNYLKSNQELKINEAYKELIYENIYDGIDLKFYFQNDLLKYDFIVHSEGNYSDILLNYNGATKLELINSNLIVQTPLGSLIETIPEVYQKNNKLKKVLKGTYQLKNTQVSFKVDNYNSSQDLIIDPWSTFIGGNDIEEAYSISHDKQKNTYIIGYTGSINFPKTAGSLDTTKNGLYDAFVTKLDTSGNALWSTFYGGIGDEYGYKVVVDINDNPYLIGYTNGNDILVSSSGVFQSNSNGSYDCFIVKLNSAGNFIWGTYFGGSGGESALSGDIDKSNNIIIGGYTSSMNMPTINPYQSTMGGALDAFVAKFDSTGNLMWSTYCGGSNSEDVHMLKVDYQNNVIISGESYSSDFPTSIGAYQSNNNGNLDVYLVKYDSLGNRIFSTYFGGFNSEDAHGLAVDSLNYIYLAGYSESLDFPIIGSNIYQSSKNGAKDAFIAKFSPSGIPLKSTFIGGSSDDVMNSLEISSTNAIYAGGYTYSTDLPIIGTPYQLNNHGLTDGFYFKLDTSLTPNYSTYIGGNSADFINDLIIDNNQLLTFGGYTSSSDFPITPNVMQTTIGGQSDAFVFQTDSTFNITTQINKIFAKDDKTTIYPNPFSDELTIYLDNFNPEKNYQLSIYNINGKKVYDNRITQEKYLIKISTKINAGNYLVIITEDRQPINTFKLIKQ